MIGPKEYLSSRNLWLSIDLLLTLLVVYMVGWFLVELMAIAGRIGAFLATIN